MSFETQSMAHCGPASLRYAFSLLGGGLRRNAEVEEQDVRRRTGLKRWQVLINGTTEYQLTRAAKRLGLRAKIHSYARRDADKVMAAIRAATERGSVVIACVHSSDEVYFHWMVVAGFSGDHAIVFDPGTTDSDRSEKLYWLADPTGELTPGLMKASRLRAWVDVEDHLADQVEDYGENHMFIEISVAREHRRKFVHGMADEALVRRMRRDLDLAASFDEYIEDLRIIFGPPSWSKRPRGVPAHSFIAANRRRIEQLPRTWIMSNSFDTATMRQEVENLLAITRCYQFTVRPGEEEKVWANLCYYLGWFSATAVHGVEKFGD